MVDKFWNFFRGSAPRWRERGRTRPAGRTALPGPTLAFEAERGPCDVRSRASRASTRARRGGPNLGVGGAALRDAWVMCWH